MATKQRTELLGLLKETLLLMRAAGVTPFEALGLLSDLLRSIREQEELLEAARHAEHPTWLYEQGL